MWSSDKLIPQATLVGMLFAYCRNTITIVKSEQTKFGYKILLSSSIRSDLPTLEAIQRTLLQHNIESKLIPKESKSYPKPILKITKIRNLHKLFELIVENQPHLPPDILIHWSDFGEVIKLIMNRQHYTTHGFDRIVMIKESWNGGN